MPRLLMATTVSGTLRAFLLPLADHLRSLGWQVDAMAQGVTASAECREHFDQRWEIEWSRNPLQPRNLWAAPNRVRQVVAEGGYDLVHVHTPVAAFITRLALRHRKREDWQPEHGQPEVWQPGHGQGEHCRPGVIYTAHGFHFHVGGNPLANRLFAGLERLAAPWTDQLVVLNREDYAAALRLSLADGSRLHLMPGVGIDLAAYGPQSATEADVARVRAELGLGDGAPLFVMVAALQPGKRHRDALRALALLRRPEAHLACAGAGPQLGALQRLVASLGIEGRVHLLGFRRDIPALIKASVATLLPSEREGLPRSVMESLCMERPVIGTAIRGVSELLADGSGILVRVGDPAGLAGAMAWILDHPEEARRMGRRGRRRMAAYALRRVLVRHEQLYAQALDGLRAGSLGPRGDHPAESQAESLAESQSTPPVESQMEPPARPPAQSPAEPLAEPVAGHQAGQE